MTNPLGVVIGHMHFVYAPPGAYVIAPFPFSHGQRDELVLCCSISVFVLGLMPSPSSPFPSIEKLLEEVDFCST
jgi:hypothetical protein